MRIVCRVAGANAVSLECADEATISDVRHQLVTLLGVPIESLVVLHSATPLSDSVELKSISFTKRPFLSVVCRRPKKVNVKVKTDAPSYHLRPRTSEGREEENTGTNTTQELGLSPESRQALMTIVRQLGEAREGAASSVASDVVSELARIALETDVSFEAILEAFVTSNQDLIQAIGRRRDGSST